MGTAVGVMGTLQAHMVLALLLRLEPAPLGQLVSVDFRTLRFGGFSFAGAHEPDSASFEFIAPCDVAEQDTVIDLRSMSEAPVSPFARAVRVEVEQLSRVAAALPEGPRVVLCCRTGVRAWRAARLLRAQGHSRLALIAFGE